jgi:hypothetical protein
MPDTQGAPATSSAYKENPNCEYTHASFRLVGDELIPATIENRTNLTGDFSSRQNDLRRGRVGRTVRQPTGVWYISSEGRVGSTSLERHLSYLLEIVEPAKRHLLDVIEEQSLRADMFCYWVSATGQGGPEIGSDTLRRISELGASLGFEFHGPWDDDESS